MSKNVLNQSELADFLGISRKTVRRLVEDGEIPGRRIGNRYFFDREIVKKWLAGEGTDEKVGGGNEKEAEIRRLREENKELKSEIDSLYEENAGLEAEKDEYLEELRLFREGVPCKVCGKPMHPDENLVEHLRESVSNWGHSSCFKREKEEKEAEKEVNSEQ